jgi:uncharacterized protein with PQ loop repeat
MDIEILGWVATLIIIISFLVNDIKLLRTFSLFGALLWVVYGFAINSNSIMFLNLVIVGIQSYKLYKIKLKKNLDI